MRYGALRNVEGAFDLVHRQYADFDLVAAFGRMSRQNLLPGHREVEFPAAEHTDRLVASGHRGFHDVAVAEPGLLERVGRGAGSDRDVDHPRIGVDAFHDGLLAARADRVERKLGRRLPETALGAHPVEKIAVAQQQSEARRPEADFARNPVARPHRDLRPVVVTLLHAELQRPRLGVGGFDDHRQLFAHRVEHLGVGDREEAGAFERNPAIDAPEADRDRLDGHMNHLGDIDRAYGTAVELRIVADQFGRYGERIGLFVDARHAHPDQLARSVTLTGALVLPEPGIGVGQEGAIAFVFGPQACGGPFRHGKPEPFAGAES